MFPGLYPNLVARVLVCVALAFAVASAEAPSLINYQGRLTDVENNPLNATVSIVFTFYDAPTAGSSKWTETHGSVIVTDGLFNVLLGSVNPILDTVFNGSDRYLGIRVGTDSEIGQRTRIVSVAYAMHANKADTASFANSSGWSVSDSVISTNKYWGIARGGAANELYGSNRHTMVNLGYSSTTGTFGENRSYSTVGGGRDNIAGQDYSTVAGGYLNEATSGSATVAGGSGNTASGPNSTIGGGQSNNAQGTNATVPGGRYNEAAGTNSFAAGYRARANHNYTFVWGDYDQFALGFSSSGDNQFLIRATGGVGIGTNSPTTQLDVNGTIKSRSGGFEFPDGTVQATAAAAAPTPPPPPPIGSVTAWLKSFANTPALPSEWVECNGQTISDAASPYNGQMIPDLNADSRFLRGYTSSGGTGGSVNHTHDISLTGSLVSQITPTRVCVDAGAYVTGNASSSPPYYRVVWIMRIK